MLRTMLFVSTVLLTSSTAMAQWGRTVAVHPWYGCPTERLGLQALHLWEADDFKAAIRLIQRYGCVRIEEATPVDIMKREFHVWCVRPRGEPECVWFPTRFLKR